MKGNKGQLEELLRGRVFAVGKFGEEPKFSDLPEVWKEKQKKKDKRIVRCNVYGGEYVCKLVDNMPDVMSEIIVDALNNYFKV